MLASEACIDCRFPMRSEIDADVCSGTIFVLYTLHYHHRNKAKDYAC